MALTAFEIDILKHFSESFMHLSQEMKICIANFWKKVVKERLVFFFGGKKLE